LKKRFESSEKSVVLSRKSDEFKNHQIVGSFLNFEEDDFENEYKSINNKYHFHL
jgi:hypothetical protein